MRTIQFDVPFKISQEQTELHFVEVEMPQKNQVVLRSDLVELLEKRFPELSRSDVKLASDAMFDTMIQGMSSGQKVCVRGFGTIDVRHRSARMGRNPQNGQDVYIPETFVAHFISAIEIPYKGNDNEE